jgi:hypothetical protein
LINDDRGDPVSDVDAGVPGAAKADVLHAARVMVLLPPTEQSIKVPNIKCHSRADPQPSPVPARTREIAGRVVTASSSPNVIRRTRPDARSPADLGGLTIGDSWLLTRPEGSL